MDLCNQCRSRSEVYIAYRDSINWTALRKMYHIAYANSEGSGESVQPRSLARTFVVRSYKHCLYITKTCLYNFDPLKPHFYIAKLGFTGVYIIFLISAQNIDCGYSLEPPRRGGSNEYPQSMFLSRNMKNIRIFYLKIFSFWWWNVQYIWIDVFS